MAKLQKKGATKKTALKLVKSGKATKTVAKAAKATVKAVVAKLVNPFANADRPKSRGFWRQGGKRPVVDVVATVKDGSTIVLKSGTKARFIQMVTEDTALVLPGLTGVSVEGDIMADAIPCPISALR